MSLRCASGWVATAVLGAALALVPASAVSAQTGDLVTAPEIVFVREGDTVKVRLELDQEITAAVPITATSSNPSRFKVNHPRFLHMGLQTTPPCNSRNTAPDCGRYDGRLVQSFITPPATERGPQVEADPAESINFSFDERDWAGYTSTSEPTLHKGWREVVIHATLTGRAPLRSDGTRSDTPQPGTDPDGVYELQLTSTDTGISLPTIKVVVQTGRGPIDPEFEPNPAPNANAGCRFVQCLALVEGGSTTYTVRNFIVPQPGSPLTITPTLESGSGVTFDPPSVSWTSLDDYLELRTITVTAAEDNDRDDEKFVIRHQFSDNWDTNGWLSKNLQNPCRRRDESNNCVATVYPRGARFNMAGWIGDNDKPDFTLHTRDGAPTSTLDLNSNSGGSTYFEIRPNTAPLYCQYRRLPQSCHETLYIRLQTHGANDRAPFSATVNGEQGTESGYWFAHAVTPSNWNEPIRVNLAMASDFGTSGSYDVSMSLTRHGDTSVEHTLSVNYGPALTSSSDNVIDPTDPQQPPDVEPPSEPLPADQQPPVVSVAAGGDVTEGGDAVFTVSASPAPTADLEVSVAVAASGDYGVADGARTVTIVSGTTSATLTVSTAGDDADEADGSVTATLNTGSGYTVSSTAGAATVAIADDDDPPPVVPPIVPVVVPPIVPVVVPPIVPVVVPPIVPVVVPPIVPVVVPPVVPVVLSVCTGLPTISVGDVTASRADASVDFVISLDCKPSRTVTVYYMIAREGDIDGDAQIVRLTADNPTATVAVSVGSTSDLALHVVYAMGAKNYSAEGTVTFSD